MQDKRNEYIHQLLSDIKSLEERVIAVKDSDAMPFSFFSESFDTTQQIVRLLHEMQLMQISEMKHQMERLVMFLSESESQRRQTPFQQEHERAEEVQQEEEAVPYAVPEASAAVELHESESMVVSEKTDTSAGETSTSDELKRTSIEKEEVVVHERNRFSNGIILPSYKNPRNADEIASNDKPAPFVMEREEKPLVTTLNDTIQASPAVLDLKRGISLNDRFLFQRELFNNDRHEMNNVMMKLNAFDDYISAEDYLRETTRWNFDDLVVKDFLRVIKKGFE